jgi:hypothetical protein
MRFKLMCLFLALVTGCAAESDDQVVGVGGGGDGSGSGAGSIKYEPFTTRTRSLGDGGSDHFMLSLTDTIGPIACSLSKDFRAGLGTDGHQIIVDVGYIAGYPCPTGTHSIHAADCPTNLANEFTLREGCGYYRRYDNTGKELGVVVATAGAVTVTGNESACTFNINLSFSGEAYSDSFTLTNGIVADPWCSQ